MALTTGAAAPIPDDVVVRVLDVVRQLARETGGARAERAVAASASLEREVGLGSLERVELVARLERTFGRALDDGCLAVDTAAGLARAILDASASEPLELPAQQQPAGAARAIQGEVLTLGASLQRRAELEPERVHVYLRGDPAGAEEAISYGRLRDEAAAVAAGLRERGVGPGDTVALMLPTGLDFLRAFFAILLVRSVPVPI